MDATAERLLTIKPKTLLRSLLALMQLSLTKSHIKQTALQSIETTCSITIPSDRILVRKLPRVMPRISAAFD